MFSTSIIRKNKAPIFGALFFLCLVFFIYLPVLNSPFLLDDKPNLAGLEQINTSSQIWPYVFSSTAGSRPLAYATFAVQAKSWRQQNPTPFKAINLLLHLINAGLLGVLCHILLPAIAPKKERLIIVVTAAGLWAIHPIHVNTILYTVQRMTILSTTFSLLALVSYCLHYNPQMNTKQAIARSTAFALFLSCAVFSKENGILTSLFLLPCLYLLNYSTKTNNINRFFNYCNVLLPFIALLSYLIVHFKFWQHYSYRDFTLAERLMTQTLIVGEYINKLVLPWPSKFSVLQDGFNLVNTPFNKSFIATFIFFCTTAFCTVGFRKKQPVFFFGVLWFAFGHLLESSFVALELYFDHRNYQPSMGLIFAAIFYSVKLWQNHPRYRKVLGVIFTLIVMHFSFVSYIEARSWQSQETLIRSNLHDNPKSQRAWQELAQWQFENGAVFSSIKTLLYIREEFSSTAGNELNLLNLLCLTKQPTHEQMQRVLSLPVNSKNFKNIDNAIKSLANTAKNNICSDFSITQYRQILRHFLNYSSEGIQRHNLIFLLAQSHYSEQQYQKALDVSLMLAEQQRNANFIFMQMQFAILASNIVELKKLYQLMQLQPAWEVAPYQESLEQAKNFIQTNHD